MNIAQGTFWGALLFALATHATEPVVQMTVQDSGYHFTFHFETSLAVDESVDILYGFEHLVAYTKTNMNPRLLAEDSLSYKTEFSFKRLFFSYKSDFKRSIDRAGDKVLVQLLSFQQKPKALARVVSSSGEYRVRETSAGATRVTFVQTVKLNKSAGRIYARVVKKNLRNFAKGIADYFEELEEKRVVVGR